jgi:transcriptional regulator with XRE-family HTH domain
MYLVRDKRQILADFVRAERTRQKLSQTDLAGRMGKVRAVVNKIESGSNDPTLDTLQDLAKALNYPLTSILDMLGYDVGLQNNDEWVEEMNYKIKLLPKALRPIAEKMFAALYDGAEQPGEPAPKPKKTKV